MTARIPDSNGWYEVKDNPISRVGVFDYLGQSCGGSDPGHIYKVLRPAEELSDPECAASFRLLPWTDDHAFLGREEDGLTPAEQKGVHGVIGEQVRFDPATQMLLANIKVWSKSLADAIEAGKRELSAGYRCVYDWTPGVWNGQPYDSVQRRIRGNHLALVDEGRMGPEVAVLDHFTFTIDAKDMTPMADEPEKKEGEDDAGGGAGEMTLAQITETLGTILPQIAKLNEAMGKLGNPAPAPGADDQPEPAAAADEEKATAGMDAAIKTLTATVEGMKKDGIKAMLAEVSARDALASRLSEHIGTFDHADKTLAEVATYGTQKLGLKVAAGHEVAALEGYLTARTVPAASSTAMDSAEVPDPLKQYGVN